MARRWTRKRSKRSSPFTPYRTERNLSWLQYALPQGIEIQTQFSDIANNKRTVGGLDVQYPIFSEFGQIPAISVGVRDLLGTGNEHHSLYAAVAQIVSPFRRPTEVRA